MKTKTKEKTQILPDKKLIKVLLVEDDAADSRLIERLLTTCSQPVEFMTELAESLSAALECLASAEYDMVLLDLSLPDSSGIETVRKVGEVNPRIPIVVITALNDEETGLLAIKNGAADFLVKGPKLDNVLVRAVLYASARRHAVEEWQRTFDSISDLIFIQDKNFTIIKANEAFVDAIGLKRENIVGNKCYEILHKTDTPWPSCPLEKTMLDMKPHTEEVCDKNIGFPLLVTTSPIFDSNGNFIGSVHIATNITNRKKAEEALRKAHNELESRVEERTIELAKANETLRNAEANLRTMIEQNADGIIIIDRKGIIRFVNDAAESLSGREKEELLGETFGSAVVKDVTTEIEVIRKGSEIVTAEMRVAEIAWEGEMVYLASLHDITERKKAEEKLKETMKIKSEFISMVSHELRTPLTAMKEGIALVADGLAGEINEEQKELLAISGKNVDRLARMINDVLDFQRIESDNVTFSMKTNDINATAKEVYDTMASSAKNTGVDLILRLNNNLPKASFDSDRITQVLTNLVSNAMKFTEKGNITIRTGKRNGTIHVSVSDAGCGIKKQDVPRVFDRFEQIAMGGERKTGGTGLGLAITKEIVERHNGTIWVESEFGKGSKFTFTLPIYSTEELFRKYVNDGIEEASKNNTEMSLILISIADFDKLKQKSSKKTISALEGVEALLENSLRRRGNSLHRAADAVFKLPGEVYALLANCGKKNTSGVKERLRQKLDDCLIPQNLVDKIELLFGCATYPDDAKTSEELIEKAKELQPLLSISSSV